MSALVIILIVLAVAVVAAGTYYVVTRRRAGVLARPEPSAPTLDEQAPPAEASVEVVEERITPSFRDRLGKARSLLGDYVGSVLSRGVDPETWKSSRRLSSGPTSESVRPPSCSTR